MLRLKGWSVGAEAAALPRRGRRGPPKSMDLWLAIAALLRPLGIQATDLGARTGINQFNQFNVHDWLSRAEAAGWIAPLPGWSGRSHRHLLPPDQVPIVGEFIRTTWLAWRDGRTVKRLKPLRRFFVAATEWPSWSAHAGVSDLLPTGVTWLEGHRGGAKALSPEGRIPRLSLIAREQAWPAIEQAMRIATRTKRERAYDSEVMILQEDHPIWSIIARRQHDEGMHLTPAMVWGVDRRASVVSCLSAISRARVAGAGGGDEGAGGLVPAMHRVRAGAGPAPVGAARVRRAGGR